MTFPATLSIIYASRLGEIIPLDLEVSGSMSNLPGSVAYGELMSVHCG